MIRIYIRSLFFLLLISCLPSLVKGQSSGVSPYSRYGIGDLDNQTGVQGFSMGNTGIALRNDSTYPFFMNLKNPAACYYNRVTTFEAGILNNNVLMSSGGQKSSSNNTYFGYFAVSMPAGKHAGLSFGITPMSSLGYDIITSSNLDSIGHPVGGITNEYIGSGGINRVFTSLAIAPCKNLSFGVNASYLFGNLGNSQTITYPLNYTAFDGERAENINIHSFYLTYGAMWTINLPASWQVVLAGTAGLSSNINADYGLLTINVMNGYAYDTIQDSNSKGKIRLPLMLGGGLTIKKGEKWTFTVDYNVQNWSQYSLFGQQQNLSNSSQMGFGAQYVPRKKVLYRAGFSYSQTYLDINNTQVKDYALTLGLALPVGISYPLHLYSVLNIGLQLGQFGTTSNNLLQEDYFKVMLGITFNNQWFIKRQYE